jgi:hypothetical protein
MPRFVTANTVRAEAWLPSQDLEMSLGETRSQEMPMLYFRR